VALSPFAAFHFLAPAWLLALPPLWALAVLGARRRRREGGWGALIDPPLLAALRLEAGARSASPWPLIALAWTLGVLALAGPAWQRVQTHGVRAPRDWIIELDLSPSMQATDVAPSRVARARYAIDDLLSAARDARLALVAFAGEAHVVTPLTTDVANVRALLQPLAPALMPESGHALAPAIDAAVDLLHSGDSRHGEVILLTDGGDDGPQALEAARRLHAAGGTLHVVGVGTEAGAPQPDGAGGFLREPQGDLSLSRLPATALRELAAAGGGDYRPLADLPALIAALRTRASPTGEGAVEERELRVEAWRNAGYWLLLPLLAVVALIARRGWL
jgi:Ca-activated chloride channel family protein